MHIPSPPYDLSLSHNLCQNPWSPGDCPAYKSWQEAEQDEKGKLAVGEEMPGHTAEQLTDNFDSIVLQLLFHEWMGTDLVKPHVAGKIIMVLHYAVGNMSAILTKMWQATIHSMLKYTGEDKDGCMKAAASCSIVDIDACKWPCGTVAPRWYINIMFKAALERDAKSRFEAAVQLLAMEHHEKHCLAIRMQIQARPTNRHCGTPSPPPARAS